MYEKLVSTKVLNRIPKPIKIFNTESSLYIINVSRLDRFYLSWVNISADILLCWKYYIKTLVCTRRGLLPFKVTFICDGKIMTPFRQEMEGKHQSFHLFCELECHQIVLALIRKWNGRVSTKSQPCFHLST